MMAGLPVKLISSSRRPASGSEPGRCADLRYQRDPRAGRRRRPLIRSRLGPAAARAFADDVAAGAFQLELLTPAELAECLDLDRRYADLGLGLADCHLVVLARDHGTTDLLSLDERHLRAVRPLRGGNAFRLLPADR
jgi:hypothetical protein